MTDRVHPSAKPAANGTAVGGGAGGGATTNTAFPSTKGQLYGASRPAYRPTPRRHRYRRSCCCSFCIWTTVAILSLIFLVAVAGVIVYLIYRPHQPTFTVSSLKVATFNLTSSSSTVAAAFNLDVTAKNPNKKLVYTYDSVAVSVTTDDGVAVGDGSVPGFTHRTKNTTLLKFAVRSRGAELDDVTVSKLRSQLRSKSGVPLKIELETKVKAKMGALKTPKIRIRVTCEGIKASPPSGKTPSTASTANAKCKVDWRVKIWKWTF